MRRPDLAGGAVTGSKVKRRGLADSDLKSHTLGARVLNASDLFTRTKIVDPAGTPSQNGKDLLGAVNSINGSGPAAPYLVQLGPGSYDLGESSIELPRNVELAGVGPRVTTITASGDSTINTDAGDEVRDLRIDAQGAASRAVTATAPLGVYDSTLSASGGTAVFIGGGGSAEVRDSTIEADAAGSQSVIAFDLDSSGSATLLNDDITATAASSSGGAVAVLSGGPGSTIAMRGSTVSASGPAGGADFGLATSRSGSIAADASSIAGTTASSNNNGGPTSTIRIGGSRLTGPAASPGFGTITCVFSYSANYAPLSSSCG